MKVGKQIKIVSYYPPEDIEKLTQLSEVTRVPKAEYLREALRDLLKRYASTLRPPTGKAKRGSA